MSHQRRQESEIEDDLSDRHKARLKKATDLMLRYMKQLAESQAAAKKNRAKMNQAQVAILKIMELMPDPDQEGYDVLDPENPDPNPDYVLKMRRRVYTRKVALNEKTIREALAEQYDDAGIVDELVAKIMSKQKSKQIVKVVPKKQKIDPEDLQGRQPRL